jgi:hypothetical protein
MKWLAYIAWGVLWFVVHGLVFAPVLRGGAGFGGLAVGILAACEVAVCMYGFRTIARYFKSSAPLAPTSAAAHGVQPVSQSDTVRQGRSRKWLERSGAAIGVLVLVATAFRLLAGERGAKAAAGRWQPLSESVEGEYDTETFHSERTDDGDSLVRAWIRYVPSRTQYVSYVAQVQGTCDRRTLHLMSWAGTKPDGTEETGSAGYKDLDMTPGSHTEAILRALCANRKPWWR